MEIRKAIELKKKLVAAKTDSTNNSPTGNAGGWGVVEHDIQLRLH